MTEASPRPRPGRGGGRTGARRALLACAGALAVACAPRPPAAVVAPPPPKRLFEPQPDAIASKVRDPHDFHGKAFCQACHVPTGALLADADVVCARCHTFHKGHTHPVGVVQKDRTGVDLPLRPDGRVACYSCHDPHQGKQLLRKPFTPLCKTCHKGH